ncbi:MAG: rhodanese-like domain-containing protein [Desulfobacteraceae bacterium]|nr:MAG: rhodanese-like domain-containing protein [Desulfobacteraceae bacterium]
MSDSHPTAPIARVPALLRQVIYILVLSALVGFMVNTFRPGGGIPLIGDFSEDARFTDGTGESMVITLHDATRAWQENRVLFLDARSPDLFAQGHIKGAKNLPWQDVDNYFMEIIDGLASDALIISYCDGETCELSHDLSLFLKDMGFPNAKVLVNGWTVWQEQGLPVEGS